MTPGGGAVRHLHCTPLGELFPLILIFHFNLFSRRNQLTESAAQGGQLASP
jgi:hypothetical protein